MSTIHVNWGESIVKLTWVKSSFPPDEKLITSAHGFCFHKKELMLVRLEHRGWDFPGGHVEADETPIETFSREALEEGCVEGASVLLGYIIVDHTQNPNWNETSKYPKIGFQAFYKMEIEHLHRFEKRYESLERVFINPSNIENYYDEWNPLYEEILHTALKDECLK
ncbi:NUDIX hydrolase [Rossellomorea sp. NS-SX7]|uniref:NUDIX hydrolase n=1 Tax=Rossellomorea sp. NS-SX7 TaxID=3463856 RepID=UPI004058F06B